MATKKADVKEVKETAVKETAVMQYRLTMPDGSIIEGSTGIREFKENTEKGFKNSGYQVKVSNGNFGGSIMIIDYTKQQKLARK
jgi:hypothetical protein